MNTCFEKHITVDTTEQTALQLLAANSTLSKQKLKKTMSNGAVWLESATGIKRLRRATRIPAIDDTIHLYYDEAIQSSSPEPARLIADEGDYSIWNKPCGMYSQGSKWGDHCTIYRWAEENLIPQRPAFLVHRLDRAANGLILLAHSKKAARLFSTLFRERQIQKQYRVSVEGRANALVLPHIMTGEIDGKTALSKIIAIEQQQPSEAETTSLIIEIETGRKHQIRRHLADMGYPVVGDRLYGSGRYDKDLQLQSCYLKFTCPLSNTVREYSI